MSDHRTSLPLQIIYQKQKQQSQTTINCVASLSIHSCHKTYKQLNHVMSIISIMATTKYVKKHITIKKYQNEHVKNKCMNLSHFVQKKLDEQIQVK